MVVSDLAALLEAEMIQHPSFRVEPWALHETELNLELLAQTESLFALSNGHIGLRGNLDEGEPHGLPGTYLNGFYELRPLPYAESVRLPESSQTLINVTNGKLIRLLVDDEPFDVRYGYARAHDRVLDFRAGTLTRTAEWTSPARRTVRVTSVRFVSFTHRAIVGIAYEVEPLDGPANIVVQSELVANEQLPSVAEDPRVAIDARIAACRSRTHLSRIRERCWSIARGAAACAWRRRWTTSSAASSRAAHRRRRHRADSARVVVTDVLEPGERLRLVKFVAYGWSHERTCRRCAIRSPPRSRRRARPDGTASLRNSGGISTTFWARADVELEGDRRAAAGGALRAFPRALCGARAEGRAIPAKGLTGTGYDGHAFWDSEMFILPVLTCTVPSAAADALRWRHSTLAAAKARAHDLGLARRRLSLAHHPRRGMLRLLARRNRGLSRQRRHRRCRDPLCQRDRRRGASSAKSVSTFCVQTARLWRSLGHHDLVGPFPHRRRDWP